MIWTSLFLFGLIRFIDGRSSVIRPNILLVIADDLRPSLGCYGDPVVKSPNIDALASSGVLFNRAYAQQALCGPSRTSFLTSRRPDTLKQIDVHHYWRHHAGNFSTLPQYFREHGYHTVSVGKIFHPGVTSNHTDDAKYSWSEPPYHPSTEAYKQAPVCPSNDSQLHTNVYCPIEIEKQPEGTLPDMQSTEFALNWLRNRHFGNFSNEPFVLAVGFHKPHIPLKFPRQFLDIYPIETVPLAPNRKLSDNLPLVAWNPWNDLRRRDDISALNISFPFGPIPDYYARYLRQGYFSSISYIDFLFGLILQEIQQHFQDTIIIFMSDHGWSLGEHQEWSKFSNYEVSTRVPLVIGTPVPPVTPCTSKNITECMTEYISFVSNGIIPDHRYKKTNDLAELVDLFPTVVDLAGLPPISQCTRATISITCTEGISQACHFTGHRQCNKKKVARSQYPRPNEKPSIDPDSDQPRLTETNIMGYSFRTDHFRYTAWVKFNHSSYMADWTQVIGRELYDHRWDDQENYNLIANKPGFQ